MKALGPLYYLSFRVEPSSFNIRNLAWASMPSSFPIFTLTSRPIDPRHLNDSIGRLNWTLPSTSELQNGCDFSVLHSPYLITGYSASVTSSRGGGGGLASLIRFGSRSKRTGLYEKSDESDESPSSNPIACTIEQTIAM